MTIVTDSLEGRLEIQSDDFGIFLLGCVDQKHIRRNIKKLACGWMQRTIYLVWGYEDYMNAF